MLVFNLISSVEGYNSNVSYVKVKSSLFYIKKRKQTFKKARLIIIK